MTLVTKPALYEHCIVIWEAMLEEAKKVSIEGEDVILYEGFLTHLFTKTRLSTPYYTSVMRELTRMDCVSQLRRGGGGSPSQWVLIQKPTTDLWENRGSKPATRRTQDLEALKQIVRDQQRQIDLLYEFTGCPRP